MCWRSFGTCTCHAHAHAHVHHTRGALTAANSMEHTFMMTLDHVGDREAMVYAQLGQQPLVECAPLRRHWNRDRGRSPV